MIIKPLFGQNEQVKLDNLERTPHILSVVDLENESSVFSNFISHEVVEGILLIIYENWNYEALNSWNKKWFDLK